MRRRVRAYERNEEFVGNEKKGCGEKEEGAGGGGGKDGARETRRIEVRCGRITET